MPAKTAKVLGEESDSNIIKFVRENDLKMKDLKKLVQSQKKQAEEIVSAYYKEGRVHPVLMKALLNGLNAAAGNHTANVARYGRMLTQMKATMDAAPDWLKDDDYLGDNKGLESRLRIAEAEEEKSRQWLNRTEELLHDQGPNILKSIAKDIKTSAAAYAKAYDDVDKILLESVCTSLRNLEPQGPQSKKGQPRPSGAKFREMSSSDPEYLIGLLNEALLSKQLLDDLVDDLVKDNDGAKGMKAPIKNVDRSMVKTFGKYDFDFSKLTGDLCMHLCS